MTERTGTEIVPHQPAEWTAEQRDLIKRTVADGATDDELAMFLHVAAKAGLDPLQKQIWFVKRRQNVGTREQPKWEEKVTIQAGVDGLQARALRQPDCRGVRSAVVYAKDDFVFDHMTGKVVRHQNNPFTQGAPVGAWAIVTREGREPFVAIVRFTEYVDERSFLWKNKPAVMIEKVARSTALRRAYPEDFAGVYEPAEMGRASREVAEPRECQHPTASLVHDLDGGPVNCGVCGVEVKAPEEAPRTAPPSNGTSAPGRLEQTAGQAIGGLVIQARTQACGARAKAMGMDEASFRALLHSTGVTRPWREWTIEDVVAVEKALDAREEADRDLERRMEEQGLRDREAEGPTS